MTGQDNNDKNKQPKKEGDGKVPARGWILLIAIVAFIPILMLLQKQAEPERKELETLTQLWKMIENDRVVKGTVVFNPNNEVQEIRGKYRAKESSDGGSEGAEGSGLQEFYLKAHLTPDDINRLHKTGKFTDEEANTMWMNIFMTLLPFMILAVLIYFFFVRQIKMAGKGALSFGKSRAKMLSKDKNKVTFKDVAGVDEAKEEVEELVDYLKDPKKFQKLGGKIPKGILMVGAPGTGKTLLAKAIAGEADASFFSISGSDFVEMFVGVGASRVRDMFEQARRNTPCLIFIDEIDAVGRSRGVGVGGGNDEREQTLNALLVEMDGFDTQDGIIIIAATNRPDVLDPALLRPGRFDRQLQVNLPDIKGREDILRVHAKSVKLESSADLKVTARGTPGFSGADLANVLNEAALLAARANKKAIGMKELEEARDKVRWGRERRSLAMTDEDKKFTAWHEAGHALVNILLPHTQPLHKVTIIPRGQSMGSTMSLPKTDVFSRRRKEMLDMVAVTMAGRIAEEIVSGDISTGAGGDIQQATQLVRAMVCQWGMSDRIGMVQYGSDEEVYLGRDMVRKKDYSENAAKEIDAEVKRIIDEQYSVAERLITENRERLEILAGHLLEYETLEGSQVEEIVKTGKLTLPEQEKREDPPSGQPAGTNLPEVPKPNPPELPGLGSPSPAPA